MDCCGHEEAQIIALCRESLSDTAVKDVFVLTYDRMRRYEGSWHIERKLLFPSYIFLESENEEQLSEELQELKELQVQTKPLFQINRKEAQILETLCGTSHHMKMSRGVIRKGSTQIMEGPLKGMEQRISRIDRHKRLARVEVTMKPDCHFIPAGLEITEKRV